MSDNDFLEKQGLGISYANIPGEVFFNHELNGTDKFVFFIINSILARYNKCWMKNEKFSKLVGVSEVSISKSLQKLQKLKYINIEGENQNRTILINSDYINIYRELVINYNKICLKEKLKAPLRKVNTINNKDNNINTSSFNKLKERSIKESFQDSPLNNSNLSENKRTIERKDLQLLLYWNSLGKPLKRIIIGNNKITEKNSLILLRKQLNNYSCDEIKSAFFKYYHLMSNLNKTYLEDKVNVTLLNFFSFDKRTEWISTKYNIKSWFDVCKNEDVDLLFQFAHSRERPKLKKKKIYDDNYPDLTKKFISVYHKKIDKNKKFNSNEKQCMIKATHLLEDFIAKNKDIEFSYEEKKDHCLIVNYVYDCILSTKKSDAIVHPGWLCQEFNYENLRQYFKNNGMIFGSDDDESIDYMKG